MSDPVMRALAYLSRVAEPPCPQLAALVARVGPVEATDRVKRRAIDEQLLRLTEARHEIDSAARDLAVLERLGGRLITAADAEWPLLAFTAFAGVDKNQRPEAHPPLALWLRGPAHLDEVAERAAAIVGTRAATTYGEHVAAELAAGLAERDAAVVSGGAYGIDGAAHRAALAADGFTVAVLAGGVDVSYPAGHAALFHRIGEQGLIVTEYPPGLRPHRHRFLTRNRLVAALAGATVVVEAGARSGAANTAAWARALGRGSARCPGQSPRRRPSAAMCCCAPARPSSRAPTRSWNWLGTRASWLPRKPGRPPCWTVSPTTSYVSTTRFRPAERGLLTRSLSRLVCHRRRCWVRWRCWRSRVWWSATVGAGNWLLGRLTLCGQQPKAAASVLAR
jgi:DNA processing protein